MPKKEGTEVDLLALERSWWPRLQGGLVGIDEAGRGCLAGPVVAAAVVLPQDLTRLGVLDGLTDSKQLSAQKRDTFFYLIQEVAEHFGVGIVSSDLIDEMNILRATFLAMERAIAPIPDIAMILVDGNQTIPRLTHSQQAVVGGDRQSLTIAAASVLAKVTRDRLMVDLEEHYPGYGLAQHKGYPTASHREAVRQLGLSPIHRKTFCREFLENSHISMPLFS